MSDKIISLDPQTTPLLSSLEQEIKIRKLDRLCVKYKKHLDEEIKKNYPNLTQNADKLWLIDNKLDSKDNLTKEKANVIQELLNILNGTEEEFLRLNEFKYHFMKKKSVIQARRDSASLTFWKGILTVISIGLAALFGIWQVKGDALCDSVEEQVNDVPKKLSL